MSQNEQQPNTAHLQLVTTVELEAMREAIKEASGAIHKLQDNGHADDCKWLRFANAKCDCGVDAADNTLAKLKPFITTP